MPNNPLDKFQSQALYYRAVNNNPYQNNTYIQNEQGKHSFQDLSGFFQDQGSYSFQWLFLHNANSDAFDNILKNMPIGLIMRNMINLAQPVYTDFTETTGEKDFLNVSADFYRELFWLEKVYVSFDFFKDSGNFIYEGGKEPQEIKHLARRGGFDLWIKLSSNDLDDDIGFMHIKTGISVKVPNWWEKMAIAEWCGDHKQNFLNWFEYSVEYLASLKKLDKFARLLVKRVRMEASGDDFVAAKEDIEAKLGTIESTITIDPKHNTDIIAVEYATGQDLESLHYTSFNTLDRRAYELGRVSNTNPKGERLTSGENYKDISSIANRQKATLEQLKKFAGQVSELWGKTLDFAVSGIPEKEMVAMENATAPHPNTEGSSSTGGAGGAGGGAMGK